MYPAQAGIVRGSYYLQQIDGVIYYTDIPQEKGELQQVAELGVSSAVIYTILRKLAVSGLGEVLKRQIPNLVGQGVRAMVGSERLEGAMDAIPL